jgi:ABC-type nitrate/sulfonate/bicarbonate transport system permease component
MVNAVTTIEERAQLERSVLALRRQTQRKEQIRKLAFGVIGLVLFLLLWEVAPRIVEGVNILMFPPPSVVAKTFWSMSASGEIWPHLLASLYRVIVGFVVGATAGVLIGVVTGSSTLARYITDPVLHGLRAIPVIAIVPLAIVWLGLGDIAKIVLIAWGVFFPVWVNTFIGIRSVSVLYLRSATSMGANQLQLMFLVSLPAALPYVFAGLRQATSLAFVVMVAAELAGAEEGLGFLISYAHLVFRIDMMFVGLIYLGALGFVSDQFFVALLHKFFPWYEERR